MTDLSQGSAQTTVERVGVEVVPERARRAPFRTVPPEGFAAAVATAEAYAAEAAAPQPQVVHVPTPPSAAVLIQAVFSAIAKVLAVRFQLLLSLMGAFVLAVMAMQWQTSAGLYVLMAFCALTTAPLVWLEFKGRPR